MKLRIASFLILSIVAFMSCTTQPTVDRSTFTGEYRPTMTNTVIDTPKLNDSTSKTLSMEEVAAKNTASECYFLIYGKIYNVTSWASQHPGGAKTIVENCGKDVTGKSIGHPGGEFNSTELQQVLKEYYVGELQS